MYVLNLRLLSMYVCFRQLSVYVCLINTRFAKAFKVISLPEVAILILLSAALTPASYINTTCWCFDPLKVYKKTRLSYINHQNIHTNGRLIRV